ncbi:hypothetical protein GCM10022379_33470 [Micromonospora maritima]
MAYGHEESSPRSSGPAVDLCVEADHTVLRRLCGQLRRRSRRTVGYPRPPRTPFRPPFLSTFPAPPVTYPSPPHPAPPSTPPLTPLIMKLAATKGTEKAANFMIVGVGVGVGVGWGRVGVGGGRSVEESHRCGRN